MVGNDRLHHYIFKDISISFSKEMLDDLGSIEDSTGISRRDNLEIFIHVNFPKYFTKEYTKLIDYNRDFRKLPDRKAILCAHGGYSGGRWTYYNSDVEHDVQHWINRNDGLYKVLMVNSCNPGNATVYSNRSALLLPNIDFSTKDIEEGLAQVELFIPEIGYIDNYCINEYVAYPEKMFKK